VKHQKRVDRKKGIERRRWNYITMGGTEQHKVIRGDIEQKNLSPTLGNSRTHSKQAREIGGGEAKEKQNKQWKNFKGKKKQTGAIR